jgi:Fanconi anemia group M protein
MGDDERLRYLVEGLPGVSAVLSRRFLEKFGTIHALVNASPEQLMAVEGVGAVTARNLHSILRTQYVGRPGA